LFPFFLVFFCGGGGGNFLSSLAMDNWVDREFGFMVDADSKELMMVFFGLVGELGFLVANVCCRCLLLLLLLLWCSRLGHLLSLFGLVWFGLVGLDWAGLVVRLLTLFRGFTSSWVVTIQYRTSVPSRWFCLLSA